MGLGPNTQFLASKGAVTHVDVITELATPDSYFIIDGAIHSYEIDKELGLTPGAIVNVDGSYNEAAKLKVAFAAAALVHKFRLIFDTGVNATVSRDGETGVFQKLIEAAPVVLISGCAACFVRGVQALPPAVGACLLRGCSPIRSLTQSPSLPSPLITDRPRGLRL